MKKFKQSMAFVIVAMIIMTMLSLAASADSKMNITFRVEGPDSNLYYGSLAVPYSDKLTAQDAFDYLDEQSSELTFTGVDDGYISAVNDIKAGKFGGWDGWYFAVNDVAASVGISDYVMSDNDSMVLYYGGYPCSLPIIDTGRLNSDGIIAFTSNDVEYDENWNATTVVNKITDAEVTVGEEKYTTDKNGEIKINETSEGVLPLQIEKKDASGAPAVLRYAPDFTVSYTPEKKDTDTASDTESDSDSDTDSDKNTSSQTSSTTTTSTVKSTATTTATKTTVATSAVTADTTVAATGDGRTYLAIGVFVVALVVVILMVVLKKKPKN